MYHKTFDQSHGILQSEASAGRAGAVEKNTIEAGENGVHTREIHKGKQRNKTITGGKDAPVDCDMYLKRHRQRLRKGNAIYNMPRKVQYNTNHSQALDVARIKMCKLLQRQNRHIDEKREENTLVKETHHRSNGTIIYPGTNYCGLGDIDIGISFPLFPRLDRCCRNHDNCPNTIAPLHRKHGVINHTLYTMSHCNCDRRFWSCLKNVGGINATLVGNTFFNTLRTKCFRKVCRPVRHRGRRTRHCYYEKVQSGSY